MQRRAATSSHASSSGPTHSSPSGPIRSLASRRGYGNKKHKLNPIVFVIAFALLLMSLSWLFFPDRVVQVEHEAEAVGHQLADKALRAEHNVQDWIQHHGGRSSNGAIPAPLDRSASDAASAAMLAQSSQWVDGEKKLKKKLTELYEKQQKGELLGVPVLTRWLGDDFPAWVTPGMDEQQWRKDVAEKYKQMRVEEDKWKEEMQKIIDKRERDLGITTAR